MTTKQYSIFSEVFWVRVIYMVITACVVYVCLFLCWVLVLIQLLITAVSGQANENLKDIGLSLAEVIATGFKFLCFQSENKPFPFSDWPQARKTDRAEQTPE